MESNPAANFMLRFFTAPNLASRTMEEGYPWDYIIPEEKNWLKRLEKAKRRKALLQKDAVWNCYSAVRGSASNLIVSNENPPSGLRGLVGDYDMKADIDAVCGYIDQTPQITHPNFIEKSLGGKIRLVWVFEREILIPSAEFCSTYLELLANKIGAPTLLAGYDKNSTKPSERWSNGGEWYGVKESPLSWEYCFGVACEVSKKASLFGRGNIPLEEIAAEIGKRWPGRWEGEFKLEATGVRFWDETADNPTGCQVKPDGMLCFTGNTPFMKWDMIFDKSWCDEKRVMNLGRAAENIVFDGKNYWELSAGHWITTQRSDILVRLRGRGLSDRVEKGETQSECEKVLDHIQQVNRVEGAAPFINFPPGIVELDGFRFLNNAYLRTVQPVAGPSGDPEVDFPFISRLMLGLFARPELNPLDYFLTWLKYSHIAFLNNEKRVGQAVFLCGPVNNGKTLLSDRIVAPLCGGRVANPMDFLTGNTQFNDELFASGLLAINDEDSPKNEQERQKMLMRLKAFVVNANHTYHPKFCSRLNIQWVGRVFVTLNDDAGSVGILPEVNKTTQDKLMFFASQPFKGVWPTQGVIEATCNQELPYFSDWLVNTYEPPAEVLDNLYRGGIKSYFDPHILDLSRQQMYSYNFEELIRAWIKFAAFWADENNEEWTGSPTDLLTDISSYEPLRMVAKEWTPSRAAKALTTLARQNGAIRYSSASAREFTIIKKLL